MSVIEAAAMRCRTMADGSLRIEVEVEPRNAQAAFALFGAPGRAVALAALKDGAGAVTEIPVSEKPKGGEWAKLAGMWCADPDFWKWVGSVMHSGRICHVYNECDASVFIREICRIESRAYLDHDSHGLHRFKIAIRDPFVEWMKANGIQK
jgi:hypothetical protein